MRWQLAAVLAIGLVVALGTMAYLLDWPLISDDRITGVPGPRNLTVTMEAHDRPSECPEDAFERSMCLRPFGDPPITSVRPEDVLRIVFLNRGSSNHTLNATTGQMDDPHRVDTPGSVALAGTNRVAPGGSANFTFTAPKGASSLYFWCDLPGHEEAGMWIWTQIVDATGD